MPELLLGWFRIAIPCPRTRKEPRDEKEMNFNIQFEPHFSKEDEEIVFGGLLEHASNETRLSVEELRSKPFAFFIRDDDEIQAGLIGHIFYQALSIDTLWVDMALRKQGAGRALLAAAEKFGKAKGCTTAYLNTLSPASVSFYEKSGYTFEFARPKYIGEFTMYYFRKAL
jgi:ribosomal protein S18 acetylase RimI-like enzyme